MSYVVIMTNVIPDFWNQLEWISKELRKTASSKTIRGFSGSNIIHKNMYGYDPKECCHSFRISWTLSTETKRHPRTEFVPSKVSAHLVGQGPSTPTQNNPQQQQESIPVPLSN